MDPITAAAITAGNQAVGGIFGFLGQRRQNRHNLRLAQDARNHDVNMWRMQNEYNTPEMQMQRLREAGLNPNLMYGQGNTGNAASPQKAHVPEVGNELAGLAQMSTIPALSLYQDFKVKNAQIDNLEAQAEATRQNAALTALRQATQNFMNKRLAIQLPWVNLQEESKTNIARHQADIQNMKSMLMQDTLPAQTQSIILRNNLLTQQIRSHRLENEFNEELKPHGMRSSDPLLLRLLMHLMPVDKGKSLIKNLFSK